MRIVKEWATILSIVLLVYLAFRTGFVSLLLRPFIVIPLH